ncbi:hypothetical protein EYF80_008144 [Liparis tanakae]|uniref:Uncharacterized protein n=1 Tax=Liparis tanakae TaxID=230148 RepID=A0A4Z2IW09_9TELE|nr:hypothetical protein EYF80_008144 [Liparis tanakae]
MFVPLPVPFVFQRTAPDLNAWRLKSPLAPRSNSDTQQLLGPLPYYLFGEGSKSWLWGRERRRRVGVPKE